MNVVRSAIDFDGFLVMETMGFDAQPWEFENFFDKQT